MNTTPQERLMQVSDEANQTQLDLAHQQGQAYLKALNHMAHDVADTGGEKPAGDYVIAYAVEHAEGMYHREGDQLVWHAPEDENAHIEISVRDAGDNRFIPGLTVTVEVSDNENNTIGEHEQPFLWHPWLYHYGRNWQLPDSGDYTLKVHVKAPDFMRHDEKNGKRYPKGVEVVFENVQIETGRK